MDEDELELQPQEPNSFFDGIGISIDKLLGCSTSHLPDLEFAYQEDELLDPTLIHT